MPATEGVADMTGGIGVRRRQQRVFLVGFIVAAVPILCQLLMLAALSAAPEAFPVADRTFTEARFWPVQVVLLCVAVGGSASGNQLLFIAIAVLFYRVHDVFSHFARNRHRMALACRDGCHWHRQFLAGLCTGNGNRRLGLNAICQSLILRAKELLQGDRRARGLVGNIHLWRSFCRRGGMDRPFGGSHSGKARRTR